MLLARPAGDGLCIFAKEAICPPEFRMKFCMRDTKPCSEPITGWQVIRSEQNGMATIWRASLIPAASHNTHPVPEESRSVLRSATLAVGNN